MVAALVAVAAVAAVLITQGVERTERGTGTGKVKPPPGTKVVSVKRTSAQDFDPLGDDDEHADAGLPRRRQGPRHVVDDRELQRRDAGGQEGRRPLRRRRARGRRHLDRDRHAEAGWQAEIHVAPDGAAPNGAPGQGHDWKEVGGGKVKRKRQRFALRTDGKRYRYYLVWITKLPPGAERVEITDVSLFRKTAS